jgi:hypothetical protein
LKLSLFTTCKGRLHHLLETLPANLKTAEKHANVEFVVMDYNSLDGMRAWAEKELAPHIESGRLVYVHEKTVQYHSMSHSKNTVLQLVTGEIAVNVDADNLISPIFIQTVFDSFAKHGSRIYVTGPQSVRRGDPRDGTYGRIAFPIEMFHQLRGYDEAMCGWGAEEWDFLRRANAVGYSQVKLPPEVIGSALQHDDEERLIKNFDPSVDRLMSLSSNMRLISQRAAGEPINPGGYGCAKVFVNFSSSSKRVGGSPAARPKPGPPTITKHGWGKGAPERRTLVTIMSYQDRPNVLMCKAWLVRAKQHCPDWDIVVAHSSDIPEIMEFANLLGGIRFEKYDITRNEIRSELCGRFGTNAQNHKIPFIRHVHDAEWPTFVFVDADAMLCGDISDLYDVTKDKPFVATTEHTPAWAKGVKVVNTGVFAYRPESKLISYERLLDEWESFGRTLMYPTGEQGIIIPLFAKEGYSWEHPKIGPEFNVIGNAVDFSMVGGKPVAKILKTPPPDTIDWIGLWTGWGCTKEAKVVHAISQFKWWSFQHLDPMWQQLVSEVYAVEARKEGR